MIRKCMQVASGLALVVVLAACATASGNPDSSTEDDNDNDVRRYDAAIPTTDYRLSDVRCESKPGKTMVDGEIIDDTHWLVVGTLHNELATSSPNYRLVATVTRADGTVKDTGGSTFRSVRAGGFAEFKIVAGGEALMGTSAVDCQVTAFDSVLNYVD